MVFSRESWTPPIVKTVASEGRGISELAVAIARYEALLDSSDLGHQRRVENWRARLVEMLRAELMQRVRRDYLTEAAARELAKEIAAHQPRSVHGGRGHPRQARTRLKPCVSFMYYSGIHFGVMLNEVKLRRHEAAFEPPAEILSEAKDPPHPRKARG